MIKRTLYFGNPAYLSVKNHQLVIHLPNARSMDDLTKQNTVPIEDIGIVILDHSQITVTHTLMMELLANTAALITCNEKHLPIGLFLPLEGHSTQTEKFRFQIQSSLPLKKNLWKQTVEQKITNQANLLNRQGVDTECMFYWRKEIVSGDANNCEARAAAYYWANLFKNKIPKFTRDRYGTPPNHLLNYGYALLRAICARSLVGSGLLPTLGIHHRNKYNAYCLADDIMEPYRPYVDEVVLELLHRYGIQQSINKEQKIALMTIPVVDVNISGKTRPLMVAMSETTASLAACFEGKNRTIKYPLLQ